MCVWHLLLPLGVMSPWQRVSLAVNADEGLEWCIPSADTQTGRCRRSIWLSAHPVMPLVCIEDVLSVCVCVCLYSPCLCVRLTEKVFVYRDEEKRYSHTRRCLATAMHRLWRTSVVAAAAKLVLYSKQGSRWPASRPAALLCRSKISFTAPCDEWEMMKLFCYQFSWPWLGLCRTASQGHRVLV